MHVFPVPQSSAARRFRNTGQYHAYLKTFLFLEALPRLKKAVVDMPLVLEKHYALTLT